MTVTYLLKHDKFGSNFVLIKQNLPNSIILPPKNGGFKARSHSVRKANYSHARSRAAHRALTGRGGVYSYILVMPDEFLLKSVVFKLISKEISRAEHEYMNIPPPPPPN